ncbi:MAG: DUF1456 family protein [Myxococcota bacterium]
MDNNGVLARLRYALDVNDAKVAEMIRSTGLVISEHEVGFMLRDEEAPDFVPCPNVVLGAFLDALILERRGPPAPGTSPPPFDNRALTNNAILKKLRVAFKLGEADMEQALTLGGMTLSKPELRALFRGDDHPNYRPCGDQVLRKFLAGLTKMLKRGPVPAPPVSPKP